MAELTYRDEDHVYHHGTLQIPGITTLLKYWGYIDDTYYTEEGRDVGTAVHAGTSALEKGEDSYQLFNNPAILKRIEAYMAFKADKRFKPELVESMHHSDLFNFACRLDRLGNFDNSSIPCIVELKCGAPAQWHQLQTAGQVICLGRPGLVRRYGLYLKKDGKYSIKEYTDPLDFSVVQSLATNYWFNKNNGIKLKGE